MSRVGGRKMNEQQNVALIQKIFEAFGRGDTEAILDHFSDDCELFYPGPAIIPYTGRKKGRAEIRAYFEAILSNQSNHNIRIDRYIAQDENVVAIGWYTGVVNSTGKTIDTPLVFTFELHSGRVLRHMLITDTAALASSYTASPTAAAGV
jgi:ketosteroid isomerase-like protein